MGGVIEVPSRVVQRDGRDGTGPCRLFEVQTGRAHVVCLKFKRDGTGPCRCLKFKRFARQMGNKKSQIEILSNHNLDKKWEPLEVGI